MASAEPSSIRIIMLGTGDFALPLFEYLCESGHHVLALVTQPDRPQGRKQELISSRINKSALARGIPVLQPENVNAPASLEVIRQFEPDLLVTAAYGQILSPALLSIPPMGGINLHGSVLPAYRGAAPVARAIQNGEAKTGVTVIRMTPQIDAGGMIAFASTPIGPDETAGEVEDRLALLGAPLIATSIEDLAAGRAKLIPQDRSKVTRAPKLRKEDGLIDWSLSAVAIHNLVRAMQPWPIASTTWTPSEGAREPVRLIVHRTTPVPPTTSHAASPGTVLESQADRLVVSTGSGELRLLWLQAPGKKPMAAEEFLRGNRIRPGEILKA